MRDHGSALRQLLRRLLDGALARRATEAGYAAVMVAIIVPVIGIGCAATAVDTGRWYVEVQRVQRTADAAALAGVPYLPQDLPSAIALAKTVAKRNGYDDASANVVVGAGLGDKATQLSVTITSTIDNVFGAAIGVPKVTISRTAVADFQGPAPMGSPCNTFGNEPNAGNGASSATPTGSAQGVPPPNCLRKPNLWATVEGPQTDKIQGDRYQTLRCASSAVDGCTSNKNDEYDDFGYVFVVKVQAGAVGKTINLQLYDPMFAYTGQTCTLLPSSSAFPVNNNAARNTSVNSYSTNSDAVNRYTSNGAYNSDSFANYCTGDSYVTGDGTTAMTTSFVLRQQTDTQNPMVSSVQNDTSGNACIRQYGSYNTSGNNISADVLTSGKGTYNADMAQSFHNWVNFCSFTPQRSGDYYLQVRTNVSMGGATVSGGTGLIKSGNQAAAAVTGAASPTGYGANSFAIRAATPAGSEQQVSVSGYNHMPIFVNAPGATATFNLIRVLPGAAGQKISFSYFDAGDASGSGSVVVQPPTDATGSILVTPFPGSCTAYGGTAGGSATSQTTLSGCSAPFTQSSGTSRNNGKTETITIPIPTDYTCNYTAFSGCWYRVQVNFPGSTSVTDVTTWDATIIGDPVRLIQ